jgi:hypothetical protein
MKRAPDRPAPPGAPERVVTEAPTVGLPELDSGARFSPG